MPVFNPNEPQNGDEVDADILRNQLNALNDKIDAVPTPTAETDPIVGAVNGIVKADGAGNIAGATPGTDYQTPLVAGSDYLTPTGDGSGLSGINTALLQLFLDSVTSLGANSGSIQFGTGACFTRFDLGPGNGVTIRTGGPDVRIYGQASDGPFGFQANSGAETWGSTSPRNTTDAINRIAAAVATLLGTPIP